MKSFNGVKIALLTPDSKILAYLRDDKPGLYMANKWDLPGGGREGNETAHQTIVREIQEEFGIAISPDQILYEANYPSERFPDSVSKFMVGRITKDQINHISFGSEGQKYKFMTIGEYLDLPKEFVVTHLQERLQDYFDKIDSLKVY